MPLPAGSTLIGLKKVPEAICVNDNWLINDEIQYLYEAQSISQSNLLAGFE